MRTPLTDFISVKAWHAKRMADDPNAAPEDIMYWQGYIDAMRDVCCEIEELKKCPRV